MARLLPETTQQAASVAGTPGYICPEYAERGTLSTKVDVWSFGVVLLELLTGKPARIPIEGKKVPLGEWLEDKLRQASAEGESNPLIRYLDAYWPEKVFLIIEVILILKVAESFLETARQCLTPLQANRPAMSTVLSQLEQLETLANESASLPQGSQTGDP